MASTELQHLLSVRDERNVNLGHDDIVWAFEPEELAPATKAWVRDYLSRSTLLTKEELTFHNASNVLGARSAKGNMTSQPLSDSDFEQAIMSLEASTAAIEKQCQLFETQKQALTELKAHNISGSTLQSQQHREKKLAREKAQNDFELDDLTDCLQSEMQKSAKQADTAVTSLPSNIDRVLEKDDRLLDGLQKLLPKLAEADAGSDLAGEVDRLCDALVTLSAQEIRIRIDATYKASADSTLTQTDGQSQEDDKQANTLRAELDELSHEIDSLATMAVDAQYYLPIQRELKGSTSSAESDRVRWTEYVATTLQYLTTRLTALDDHFQNLHAHQGALKQLTGTLESVLAPPGTMQRAEGQSVVKTPATPTSAKGLKPLRLVEANKLSEPQDPILQILRQHDIRVSDISDTGKLYTALEQAVAERRTRLAQLGRSTEHTITDQLSDSIMKADRDVRDLLVAVYAHSPYGTVRLVDGDVQSGMEALQVKTEELGQQMRELDLEDITRQIRERQKEVLGR